jgi:Protein of unknown function (DUF3426)
MVREQLDASGGWVRCGHCMNVFDAKTQLVGSDVPAQDSATSGLSFVQQASKQAFWHTTSMRTALTLLCLMLGLLLSIQVVRSERDRLAMKAPAIASASQWLCALWPCTPIARLQMDGWLLDNSDFQKSSEGKFLLSVVLKNTSPNQLLIPHLDVSLLDAQGSVVIRKSIDLSTDPSGQVNATPSGEERKFDLVLAPTAGLTSITGYRLVLFYP